MLGFLLLAGGVAAYLVYDRIVERPGDISNPDVEFVEPTATPEPEKPKKGRKPRPFSWPRYGFTKDHNRNFQPGYSLRGPFRAQWKRKASALTEFPPVLHDDVLYQISDDGRLKAMTAERGKVLWRKRLGRLSASSPALDGRRVYATLLQGRNGGGGRVVAVDERTGNIRWSRRLPSRTESSPLVHGGKVYVGSEDGTLYALWARTGNVSWTYRANGAIKGSPTLANGVLYFGDYGGYLHAVRLSGRRVWSKPVARRSFRSGRFYATAAVAYGRVYIGSTDGREYAVSARTGNIAWARQTGNYVYSSAAIANVDGQGPTVFFGSYDGRLYALNARSGATRWTFRSGGKISGSPTVIGGIVYFSDLGRSRTYGLLTRSGRAVFRRDLGGYDPIISDGRHLFLTGRRSLTSLLARNAPKPARVRQPPGTALPVVRDARKAKKSKAGTRKKAAGAKRARAARKRRALQRCARRDTRAARRRCRNRIR